MIIEKVGSSCELLFARLPRRSAAGVLLVPKKTHFSLNFLQASQVKAVKQLKQGQAVYRDELEVNYSDRIRERNLSFWT